MRKAMLLLAVFAFVGVLWAQTPFDGTWKIDVKNIQFPEKPEVWVIQNGTYVCSTCDPKINVKADGSDQPVRGSKAFDTLAVKIVDDKSVEMTRKKSGKVVGSEKSSVSADGKTFSADIIEYPEASKQPVTIKATMIRVAAGPAGSHAFSGSWRIQKGSAAASDNALTFTYKSSPNGLMVSSPTGESYDAKFDGKDYPIKGDPEGIMVSLTKVSERIVDETIKRDGKIVQINHMTVSSDGKALTVKSENKVQGTTTTYIATKQ